MAKPVHIGCSGWNYRDWRGPIYPEKLPARRWLEHYATLFDTVEINNTFYRLPTESAVTGWVEQSPRGFRFAVKGSRYITHIKRLRDLTATIIAALPAEREDDLCAHALDNITLPFPLP